MELILLPAFTNKLKISPSIHPTVEQPLTSGAIVEGTRDITEIRLRDSEVLKARLFPTLLIDDERVSLMKLTLYTLMFGLLHWGLFLILLFALPDINGFAIIWVCQDTSLAIYLAWLAVFIGGQTVPGMTLTGPDCAISLGCRAHLSLGGFYLPYL
jgi:hypothetical protein